MTSEEMGARLRDDGVVLLRDFFGKETLIRLQEATTRCFDAIQRRAPVPEHYRFTPHSHSVVLSALLDFGCGTEEDLTAPLAQPGLAEIFSEVMGGAWRCALEQSWVRKKFAPRSAPGAGHNRQDWHQDGALGVQFPPQPGSFLPMTQLLTCWIALQACGRDSPGLEFIREPQPALLHFTQLNNTLLRQRFDAAAFWAPELELGDGLVFRNDILHRTHVEAGMCGDRISVEYRIFPPEA